MSSTLQHPPTIDPRKQELLEARLSGGGSGGGGSQGSSNKPPSSLPGSTNMSAGTTYFALVSDVPNMNLAPSMKTAQFVLQGPIGEQQLFLQSSNQQQQQLHLLSQQQAPVAAGNPAFPAETNPVMKEDSNVSARSTSSHSGELLVEIPIGEVRGSASSNSISQTSAPLPTSDTGIVIPEPRKRKRGKPKDAPVKGIKVEIPAAAAVVASNGPSNRKITDFYKTSPSSGGSPMPSGAGRPPSGSGNVSIQPGGGSGSRSPLHAPSAATTTYYSVSMTGPQQQPQLIASASPVQVLNHVSGPNRCNSASSQTDLNQREMMLMMKRESMDKADKDKAVQAYEVKVSDLQKEVIRLKHKLEVSEDRLGKCVDMEKKLLSEKSGMERKSARSKSVHNRMKLGQFVTQREGANFEEKFLDGYAFIEIHKKMDELAAEKEELDRRRKLLQKRKPTDKITRRNATAANALVTAAGVKQENSMDADTTALATPGVSSPFAGPLSAATGCSNNGPANWPTDFIQPEVKEWTWSDYYQEDEILKLRTATLKKDEQDCQAELEKMERERLIHIRELKRIFNEDQSVFKNNPVLNQRYLLLTLIGKGGFSEVHKAFDMEEQRYVAVKVHQLIKEWKDEKKANYIKHALREYHVHKHLTHPRVVKLYDVFEIDSNSFATILEYVDGNDLDFYLKQQKTIPEREARAMICQVVSALKYFNELKPPIIHYDLKPGNILLGNGNSSGEIKVTDFGLSKVCDDEHYDSDFGMDLTSQGAGTYWYLPPEVFETSNTPKISSKVDVWSVGVIFYQMLYGKKPYGDKQSQREVLQNFTILNAKEVEFPTKPQISLEAKNFIRKCLTLRKDERPEVRQLVHDDYLQLGTKLTRGNASVAPAASFNAAGPSNILY